MVLCDDPAFVFLAVPRTGSRSMQAALRAAFPRSRDARRHHGMDIPPSCRDYFTFACVRNPFTRELSHYLYRRSRSHNNMVEWCRRWTFKQYLRWLVTPDAKPVGPHDPCQSAFLAGVRLDTVVRFEDLPRAFSELPVFGKAVPLPHRNENAPYRLEAYYGEETMDLVRAHAGGDFLRFDYDPDVLPLQSARKSTR